MGGGGKVGLIISCFSGNEPSLPPKWQVMIEDWAGEKGRNQAKEGKCALPISAQTGVHYQIGHGF